MGSFIDWAINWKRSRHFKKKTVNKVKKKRKRDITKASRKRNRPH